MKLNETIRRLRRAKGLTQEQVAQALGVSGPAVNKWERGACCPDLALLAPLARLLDTDLNTLLSFREELTGAEIAAFTEELYTLAQSRGIDAAFLRAEELLHRWPGCDRLTISLAMTLNGLFFTLGVAEPEPYERRLEPLYRALADSEEPDIRDQALHLLIGRHMRREEYAAASRVSKKRVVDGMLEAIEAAKLKADPAVMVAGWKEIGRLCGHYEPTKTQIEVSVNGQVMLQKMTAMSDEELLRLASEDAVDADVIEAGDE